MLPELGIGWPDGVAEPELGEAAPLLGVEPVVEAPPFVAGALLFDALAGVLALFGAAPSLFPLPDPELGVVADPLADLSSFFPFDLLLDLSFFLSLLFDLLFDLDPEASLRNV